MSLFKLRKTPLEGEKKSFSQCGEDLIIQFIFANYLKINNPSYIDIGAHHPFYLNNTALFYELGSTGVNIEPNTDLFELFKQNRKRDVNLNIGIADINSELDFYIMTAPTMSTFSKVEADLLEKTTSIKIKEVKKIEVQTLNHILDKYCLNVFPDFLSLDVEGLEDSILNSIDFDKNYPKVICLETLSYSENNDEKKDVHLVDFLIDKGYFVYADTYINTIFVSSAEWSKRK